MSSMGPNLAARPFANERPVKRTTTLIWVLALTLMAVNIFLYQRHLSAQYEQRQALRDLEERIQEEEEVVRQGQERLADLDLRQQNAKVVFLNGQIARRTFSWSQLFDRLEEVLPANMQLQRVSPKILTEGRRGGRPGDERLKDLVSIDMKGQARTGEEVLQLVDSLFEHESFTLPNLKGENQRDDGRVEFTLNVLYLPTVRPSGTVTLIEGEAAAAVVLGTETAGGDG